MASETHTSSFQPHVKQHSPGGIREMLAIAVPMVASNACETVMTFTDRLFLSRVGPQYMSGAMAGGLTSFMMMTFFLGLTGYCTALVAQYLGAGRKDRCAVALTQAIIIALISYPIILLCKPFGHALFEITSIPEEQLGPQRTYFDIMMGGTIVALMRNCFAGFFSGIGRTRIVLVASLTAMLANIVGNYVLIFGHFGFPAMGIAGAAYGTIFGGVCGLAVLVVGYLRRSNRNEFGVLRALRYHRETMGKLFRYGYPGGVELFLNLLAFDLLILVFHSRGLEAATAITVVFNWDMVSFVPLIGINVGVMSLVGRYMGAGSPATAHRATMSGLKLALMYGCCTLFTFSVFSHTLVGVFRPPGDAAIFEKAYPAAVIMVRIAAIYILADAMNLVFSGALRGAGDTLWAMIISVGLHWVLVVVLVIMLKAFNVRVETAWFALALLILLFTGAFFWRYASGKWRTMRVVEPTTSPAADGLHDTPDL